MPGPGRLQRLWRLPRARKRLLIESGWTLASMAWRVRQWPFARLAATLGNLLPAAALVNGEPLAPLPPARSADLAMAADVRWALAGWTRVLRQAPTCLMQATAAQRLLARRGLASDLYFGVQSTAAAAAATQPRSGPGAHAWLRCAGQIVTGEKEAAKFRTIAVYRLQPSATRR